MKKRILVWIISLIIAVSYIAISEYIKNLPEEEISKIMKDTVNEYNDIGNNTIIEKVFENSNLSQTKNLNHVTEKDNANIIISENLENVTTKDGNTILTSYTPLIIGMKKSDKFLTYQEKGLMNSSEEIDFKKIIDAVVDGKTWSEFGAGNEKINVFIPKKDSIKGKIFYNFLLVTLSDGKTLGYDEDMIEKANLFLESCTETDNVIDELKKISSVNSSDLYVMFEADFMNSSVWTEKKLDISIVYPTLTLVRHLYIQVPENEFSDYSAFFNSLSEELNYRTSNTHSFTEKNYNVKENITFVDVNSLLELPDDVRSSGKFRSIITIIIIIIVIIIVGIGYEVKEEKNLY